MKMWPAWGCRIKAQVNHVVEARIWGGKSQAKDSLGSENVGVLNL